MPQNKNYKYLDLSGYAFTGKHAVIDLLREFKGYNVPHFEFEFNLLRIQGGIRDLETALVDDWSPIRSDAAVRRFRLVTNRLAAKNSYLDPLSWFSAAGWNYEDYFNGQFRNLSEEYLTSLITSSWVTNWPYPLLEVSNCDLFLRKLLKLLGSGKSMDFEVCLAAPDKFVELTQSYMSGLMAAFVNNCDTTNTVVMHNSFEPFNPGRSLKYFADAKCIIVDRDPRDNYVAGLWYRPTALPVSQFIQRYRLYRQAASPSGLEGGRILKVRFEELVFDYSSTLAKILSFLGESPSIHAEPKKYFDPAVSAKNVGIWKTYEKQDEIEMIARELKEYCHD